MSCLAKAPSPIYWLWDISITKNYWFQAEKYLSIGQPLRAWGFMSDLILVWMSPGDEVLSGTEILINQITKAQRVTLSSSKSTETEEEMIAGFQSPNTSTVEVWKTIQVIKTTKWTANRASSNNKNTLTSIRVAVEQFSYSKCLLLCSI